ncbi:hypothetical protein ACFU8W_18725 [Streptomyces sp. NPDC057565]|uniref:hypothetical protein n=1 Tax=Streptomyces sp. NPDC057565 TaxID=3346169 RepID=UPI0036A5C377
MARVDHRMTGFGIALPQPQVTDGKREISVEVGGNGPLERSGWPLGRSPVSTALFRRGV